MNNLYAQTPFQTWSGHETNLQVVSSIYIEQHSLDLKLHFYRSLQWMVLKQMHACIYPNY